MMHHRSNHLRLVAVQVFLVGLLAAAATMSTLYAQDQLDFFAIFLNANGSPVTDVTASEITMLEAGVQGSVTLLEPVNRPLDVTLLIDNGLGMGSALAELRTGAKGFFSALPEDAQLSLLTLAPQPRWLLRPTTGRESALRAVDRITPDQSFGRFLDALVEAGDRMGKQSENRFPVIVAIGSNAPDGSNSREQHFTKLAQRLVDASATVHATVLSSGVRAGGGRMPGGVVSDSQNIIGFELAKLTGGRYEQIAASSRLATLLPELGNQIRAESRGYRLRARRPEGAKGPVGAVAFGISRQGVTIRTSYDNTRRK